MPIIGWYYLHENGTLIYRRELDDTVADLRESDFVRSIWPFDPRDRSSAWRLLVEALCLGVNKDRINELAEKWGCSDGDADIYAERIGINLFLDGNAWGAARKDFVNLQESPSGFGNTKLEAMAELCKELGYKPSKMWGATFHDLVRQ